MRQMRGGVRWIIVGAVMVVGSWLPGVASAEGGTVQGRVVFQGTAPARKPVEFGAEKQCALVHGEHRPLMEDLIVNGNGTLKNVLLYITGEVPGTFLAPAEPLVFEQTGCVFAPHVGAVMVGQPVQIVNDDALLHNVRAQSKRGQSFNVAQPVQGMKTTKTLGKPEIGIPLKCDVHFWMTAYLHVVSHPFFAVTGDDGSFSLSGVPPGAYTLEAWHEQMGTSTQTVTVQDGGATTVEFVFRPKG